jgi:hypothetical protein
MPRAFNLRLYIARLHDPKYPRMPFLASPPAPFSTGLLKFVLQAARSTSATPTIQLIFCLPGYDVQPTHTLGSYTELGLEAGKSDLCFSGHGVDFLIVGFVEKPCVVHYKKVIDSEICRKCSPGRFHLNRKVGDGGCFSRWVDSKEWAGEWMESL